MGTREILDVRLEQVEHNGGNNGSGGDGSWEEVAGRHPRHQAGPRPLQIPHISIFFYLFQFFFNLKKWQEVTHGSKLDLVLLNIPHISILFTFLAALVALHFIPVSKSLDQWVVVSN